MKNPEIKFFDALTDELVLDLVSIENQVFEKPMSAEDIVAELGGRKSLVVLVAYSGASPCGYKIGFEYSVSTFFSWSGAVVPACRRCGLGTRLMEEQHLKAKQMGFIYMRTHTKNKYREMLILNLKFGFDITGFYKTLGEAQPGIVLEKML